MTYYSGCNYNINTGTAISMHECGACQYLAVCRLKKETAAWEYNENIAKQIDAEWKKMLGVAVV